MMVNLLHASQAIIGESPCWHRVRKCCYWVDIEKGILFECNWDSRQTKTWKFDYHLSLVIQAQDKKLVLALDTRLARFDPDTGKLQWLLEVEKPSPVMRCNDGACDSRGRLWIGTMHLDHKKGAGALYCIDENAEVEKKIGRTTISNGIAWSPDNKYLYYIDSPTRVVQAFRFDEASGNIVFEKNIIEVPADMGTPDGMAIDDEGMLWIAHWGGFGVYRWNPFLGRVISKIDVPAPQVSSCAFAGDNLDHLIITTARENMREEDLKKYTESGNTFWINPGVRGLASANSIL